MGSSNDYLYNIISMGDIIFSISPVTHIYGIMIQEYIALGIFLFALGITITALVRFFINLKNRRNQDCGANCNCHGTSSRPFRHHGKELNKNLKYRHVSLK